MPLTEAELTTLVADLEHQYRVVSREHAAAHDIELRAELADVLASLEYRIYRMEGQRLALLEMEGRHIEQLLADLLISQDSHQHSRQPSRHFVAAAG